MSRTQNTISICACLSVFVLASLPDLAGASLNKSRAKLDENYGRLPVAFEPNLGQTAMPASFLARNRDGVIYLQPEGLMFKLPYRDSETSKISADTVDLRF